MHHELKRMIGKKPKICLLVIFLGFVESLLLLGNTVILKSFFEDIASAVTSNLGINHLLIGFGILIIIIISSDILNAISNFVTDKQKIAVTGEIMEDFFQKIKTIKALDFEEPKLLDAINKARYGIGKSIQLLIKTELIISNYTFYFIMIFVYLFSLHPLLSIIIWCIFIPTFISYRYRNQIQGITEEKIAVERRKMNAFEAYIGDRKFFKETRHLDAVKYFKNKFTNSLNTYNKLKLSNFNKINTIKLVLNIIHFIGFIVILGILYYLVLIKEVSVGEVGAVLITVKLIYGRMEELFNYQLADVSETLNGLYNLNYLLEMKEEIREELLQGDELEISVRDVSFKYPNASCNALSNIFLDIKPKEVIAIVGENGSGKTTLSKLIAGLYQPANGEVFYNGASVYELDLSSLYKKVTIVFQNFQQYALSIKENIAISDINNINDYRVIKSLNSVDLIKVISKWKDGMDTLLSKEFGGTDLSLGQWQSLAVARANYKDASLIVFDEPTASLDPLKEMDIMKKFIKGTQGKTAILVTHRIGAAKLANRIVTMKAGRIVETGTHSELLNQNGEYAKLYYSQKQWYE